MRTNYAKRTSAALFQQSRNVNAATRVRTHTIETSSAGFSDCWRRSLAASSEETIRDTRRSSIRRITKFTLRKCRNLRFSHPAPSSDPYAPPTGVDFTSSPNRTKFSLPAERDALTSHIRLPHESTFHVVWPTHQKTRLFTFSELVGRTRRPSHLPSPIVCHTPQFVVERKFAFSPFISWIY